MSDEIKPVELGDKVKGEIELPTLDIKPYIGQKTTIENISEHEGKYGYFIKLETEVIDTIEDFKTKDGSPLKLRASMIFGLQTNKKDEIGWGKDTKLAVFLKQNKVEHYRDLAGKEVTVQATADGKFLGFI